MRVLEIVLHTGRTLTEFQAKANASVDYDFRYCVAHDHRLSGHHMFPLKAWLLCVLFMFMLRHLSIPDRMLFFVYSCV